MATKTYDEYRKKQRENAVADYERGAEQRKQATEMEVNADHVRIDTDKQNTLAELSADVQTAEQTRRKAVDKAAVDRMVNEHNLSERMSALGLVQSGAFRAAKQGAQNKQTVAVGAANKAFADTAAAIEREAAATVSTADADKQAATMKRWAAYLQEDASAYASSMKQADSTALSVYKADQSAETSRYKADKDAEADKYKADKDAEADMYKADASTAATIYKADATAANNTTKLIAAVDTQLRKKTNGAYGLSQNGTVISLKEG